MMSCGVEGGCGGKQAQQRVMLAKMHGDTGPLSALFEARLSADRTPLAHQPFKQRVVSINPSAAASASTLRMKWRTTAAQLTSTAAICPVRPTHRPG